ncbi:hypothetical protein BH18ACT9_BH18ACT9_18080 [soil metagenome]
MDAPAGSPEASAPRPRGAPTPLLVAVGLASLEGGLIIAYGVAELAAVQGPRLTMGISTTLFFWLYGGGLLYCAWAAYRRRSWARAPVVLAQLIQLGVASSFWGGSSTVTAATMGLVALAVLVGIFHPASIGAMGDEPL